MMKFHDAARSRSAVVFALAAVSAGAAAQLRPPVRPTTNPTLRPPNLTIQTPRTMPTYSVVRGSLPPDQGRKFAESLHPGGANFAMGDGSVRFYSPSFLNIPSKVVPDDSKDEGDRPVVAHAFDFDRLAQQKLISPTQAQARLQGALRAAGIALPGGKAVTGHSMLEFEIRGEAVKRIPLDTFVTYNFSLGTTPLVGPGAKVRAAFDGNGKVSQVRFAYRQLKQGAAVPVLSPAEADRILIGLLKSKPETVSRLTKRLVYYAPPIELGSVRTIFPHYLYGGSFRVGNETVPMREILLPAVANMPRATVSAKGEGPAVTARATVRGGRAPYRYKWSTSGAPVVGSTADFRYQKPKGRGTQDVLTLVVTDADGLRTVTHVNVQATPAELLQVSMNPEPRAPAVPFVAEPGTNPLAVGPLDVGAEYVGSSYPDIGQNALGLTPGNAAGFRNEMASNGVPSAFFWGERDAWEDDFKSSGSGGDDANFADNVDMAFFTGHANGNGFIFSSSRDDNWVLGGDARWGDRDAEWTVIAACGPLQASTGSGSLFSRWGNAFQGLHAMLGYATNSADTDDEGWKMTQYMTGLKILGIRVFPPLTVVQSWFATAMDIQGGSVVVGAMGPIRDDGVTNQNDYFWGRGSTGPDIRGARKTGHWVIRTNC